MDPSDLVLAPDGRCGSPTPRQTGSPCSTPWTPRPASRRSPRGPATSRTPTGSPSSPSTHRGSRGQRRGRPLDGARRAGGNHAPGAGEREPPPAGGRPPVPTLRDVRRGPGGHVRHPRRGRRRLRRIPRRGRGGQSLREAAGRGAGRGLRSLPGPTRPERPRPLRSAGPDHRTGRGRGGRPWRPAVGRGRRATGDLGLRPERRSRGQRDPAAARGLLGGRQRAPGLDYDFGSDTLYVACSSGAVFVYEDFVAVPGDLPDRTITPGDALGLRPDLLQPARHRPRRRA